MTESGCSHYFYEIISFCIDGPRISPPSAVFCLAKRPLRCATVIRSGRNRPCSPSRTSTRACLSRMQFSELLFPAPIPLCQFSLQSFLAFIHHSCPLFLTLHLHVVIDSHADETVHQPKHIHQHKCQSIPANTVGYSALHNVFM